MATNRVIVTLQIRNDEARDWLATNPTLASGEYGLESDTLLLKVGDGVRDWEHLPYLNKLETRYFTRKLDGSLTFSSEFEEAINNLIAQAGGDAHLVINDDPEESTDPVNYDYLQRFVAQAISEAGHLKREIVLELPQAANADEDTLYMVPSSNGEYYEEYMVINGEWDMVGETGDGGSGGFTLEVANTTRLGGVKADDPSMPGHENTEYLSVTQEGFMTLNKVSTSKLFVPTGDTLIIFGGTA